MAFIDNITYFKGFSNKLSIFLSIIQKNSAKKQKIYCKFHVDVVIGNIANYKFA